MLAEEAGDGAAAAAGGPTTSTLRTQLTPAAASALHSPLLKPLSPPPADAEVQQLEAEVNEASQRVAALRTSMQAALQEQLAAKLAALRPTAELDDQEPAASAVAAEQQQAAGEDGAQPATEQQQGGEAAPEQQGGSGEAPAAPPAEQQATAAAVDGEQAQPMEEDPAPAPALQLSPQADELQARLLAAANRMPALRARLEQATDRLQRVVAAVAADIARPPPNTVEKAVLGKTPGRPGTGRAGAAAAGDEENVPGVSPLLQQVGCRSRWEALVWEHADVQQLIGCWHAAGSAARQPLLPDECPASVRRRWRAARSRRGGAACRAMCSLCPTASRSEAPPALEAHLCTLTCERTPQALADRWGCRLTPDPTRPDPSCRPPAVFPPALSPPTCCSLGDACEPLGGLDAPPASTSWAGAARM